MMRRFKPLVAAVPMVAATPSMQAMFQSSTQGKYPPPKCLPNFDDPSCYSDKSLYQLLKSIAVLKVCGIEFIAKNSVGMMKVAEKCIGSTLTYDVFVKHTIYNYFCAGANDQELKRTVKKLEKDGIGSVLDYAAEADAEGFAPAPGQAEAPDISMASLVNKPNVVYPDHTIAYEENKKLYMMSIMHAALHAPSYGPGVVAVKVSGMCDPQLLARLSAILMSIHQSWCEHFTQEEIPKIEECRVVMGVAQKHQLYISHEQLKQGFSRYCPEKPLTDADFKMLITQLDPENTGKVSYFRYKQALTDAVTALDPSSEQKAIIQRLPPLSPTEKQLWKDVNKRLSMIATTATYLNVRMMIDAEQTFYQLAIDAITMRLQRKYNKDAAVVYNTYQCYLTYAEDRIHNDLIRANKLGYHWGGKIVRGAYMVQERKTAQEYNYTSPIWGSYEETNKAYESSALRILNEIEKHPDMNYEVFFGTHNRQSLEMITKYVIDHPLVQNKTAFGQLLGMRDNLTIPLAKARFNVYKYVPYGPTKETIHYLGRRAVENSSVLGQGETDETRMIKAEIRKRLGMTK